MNTVREVLAEVKSQRLTEERIEALKKPWHAPFWPLLAQAPWFAYFIWLSSASRVERSWADIGCLILLGAFTISAVVSATKRRDRMWREVIEREAPLLHARLSEKNA